MKRTSSIAALDDTIDTKGLVSEMMLISLADGKNRNHRRGSNSMGSLSSSGSGGSVSSSRMSSCSSRVSISGWGSTASRKSYKVDLCSLADEIIIPVELSSFSTNTHTKEQDIIVQQEQENNKCCTIAMRQKGDASGTSHTATAGANAVLDSWGFFLE
jgi:hypothetical protein